MSIALLTVLHLASHMILCMAYSRGDSLKTFTSDYVTPDKYWRIASPLTKNRTGTKSVANLAGHLHTVYLKYRIEPTPFYIYLI